MSSKRKITNILISLFSALITLLLAEGLFRILLFSNSDFIKPLKIPEYYSDHIKNEKDAFYNDNYWKLNYLFNKPISFESPHPLLGWTGKFYWKTLDHLEQEEIKNRKPVLLYGDSFAMCVDSVKCFEDFLNNDSAFAADHFLLNYGVGGYGVDQISLLLKETVKRFDKPFVIFSLLTSDMDRSMLTVRDGQKPYFQLTNDTLQLQGVPITLSSKEFFDQNPPEINSYLWNKFKSSRLYATKDTLSVIEYIRQSKALNKAILEETFKSLKALDSDFVVLIFHPEHKDEKDWRLPFLRELCIENKVPYICDLDIKNADNTFSTYNTLNYAIENDGHPTSYANELTSNELKRYILNPKFRKKFQYDNSGLSQNSRVVKDFLYYKKLILRSPEWLAKLKEKATLHNITLDSMISLDAQYMADQEKNIDYFKKQILNSPEWLATIKEKAIQNNISIDSMIFLDAQYLAHQELMSEK